MIGIAKGNRIDFGDYNKKKLADDVRQNQGAKYKLERLTMESRKQRRFYQGAVVPLYAFLNGYDWRESTTLNWLHQTLKIEFNGELVPLDGKMVKRGKTTRGKLNSGFLERVIDYLEEQYAIDRKEVLDNKAYKYWRDVLYPQGGPEDYISYLLSIGKLKLPAHELRDEIENG